MTLVNTNSCQEVVLIGTGPMAIEYARVLKSLGVQIVAVGRGEASAQKFESETGVVPVTGGVEVWAQKNRGKLPSTAIVACGEKWIGVAARALMVAGVRKLLLEKPGGFDVQDITQVHECARNEMAQVFVGYNRRFYASVKAARDIIVEDGGVTSFNFEFTEWSHVISGLNKEEGVKEQWFLSNSTHLIDLAYFLGGRPVDWQAYVAGTLDWHPQAAVFAGAGRSELGALFSYQANWLSPGRFGLDVLTRKRRLIFRPIEKLQVQNIGSVAINPVEIEDALDCTYKPGLYRQTEAFLSGKVGDCLPTLASQVSMLPYYMKMRGDTR